MSADVERIRSILLDRSYDERISFFVLREGRYWVRERLESCALLAVYIPFDSDGDKHYAYGFVSYDSEYAMAKWLSHVPSMTLFYGHTLSEARREFLRQSPSGDFPYVVLGP